MFVRNNFNFLCLFYSKSTYMHDDDHNQQTTYNGQWQWRTTTTTTKKKCRRPTNLNRRIQQNESKRRHTHTHKSLTSLCKFSSLCLSLSFFLSGKKLVLIIIDRIQKTGKQTKCHNDNNHEEEEKESCPVKFFFLV